MVVINELDADWSDLSHDPLVTRLRDLSWAEVPDDTRARCWERISGHLTAMPQDMPAQAPAAVRDAGERYDFSRRLIPRRLSVAQGWARRPSHTRALAHA